MNLIINENNLKTGDVSETSLKVRALLVNDEGEILIERFGNTVLFPGGTIYSNESIFRGIVGELKEETGCEYNSDELKFLASVYHFQKGYPMNDGKTKNRLVVTNYFIGDYKYEIGNADESSFELVSLEELENLVSINDNDNLKNKFFKEEVVEVIKAYKKYKGKTLSKKIK